MSDDSDSATDGDSPIDLVAEMAALLETKTGDELSEELARLYRRAAEAQIEPALSDPRSALAEDRSAQAAFEARLVGRWGAALDLFELTVQFARNAGAWIDSTFRDKAVQEQDHKFEALARLHGRSVMIAQEVLTLLRGGYSSGAMSRWRTLHEIWVVFSLLSSGDRELSRRYLLHHAVEAMKAEVDYEQTYRVFGYEPPDWTSEERETLRVNLASEFGDEYLKDYGWAATLFDGRAPKFRQLQEMAELDHWRSHYRLASHSTHANPHGVMFSIQVTRDIDILPAGPSNAGLLEPAQSALIALGNVTIGWLQFSNSEFEDGDEALAHQVLALVSMQSVLALLDTAIESFVRIHEIQQDQEDELMEVIAQITAALETPLDAEELINCIDLDPGWIEEVLAIGVDRGLIERQVRFRRPPE